MKTHYLPVMVVKDVRKGYSVVNDEDEIWGFVAYLAFAKARKKGFLIHRSIEKIGNIIAIHYPVLNVCINDKCYLFNLETKRQIEDYGVVGSFAILSSFSSPSPYVALSRNIDLGNKVESTSLNDEYSMPLIKSGEGIYYLPFIYVEYVNKHLRREIIPPIYRVSSTPGFYVKPELREFNEFLRLIKSSETIHRVIGEAEDLKYRFLPEYVGRIKKGLTKLVDKKLITWSEAAHINYILP